jgi:hypothetical protein
MGGSLITIGAGLPGGEPVSVPDEALAQHAALFGGSGFGKTYLSHILCREQLRRGASLVAVDPKPATIRRLRSACAEAGLPPDRVVTVMAEEAHAAPGMNPFLFGGRPEARAALVYDLLDRLVGFDAGPRIEQYLTYAVRVAAWHGLALGDVPRLLHDDAFRRAVLGWPSLHPVSEVYDEAASFFEGRFLSYSASNRETTTQSIETRFTKLLNNSLFLRLFNATTNTVHFEPLFSRQGAVLVCIGEGHGVTASAARLLGALTVHALYAAAASRQSGDLPVVLLCDEIRKIGGALEEGLRDVTNMARESGIRLLVAGQHAGQIADGAREDILASSAIKAYFNPGGNPVEDVARLLADRERLAGGEALEDTPHLPPPYRGKLLAASLDDPLGGAAPIRAATPPPSAPLPVDLENPGATIKRFLMHAPGVVPPAYLEDGRRASEALAGLPPGSCAFLQWRTGIAHAEVHVPPASSLHPTPSARDRWAATLRTLGMGEAVVLAGNAPPQVVRVTRINPSADAPRPYVEASRNAHRVAPGVRYRFVGSLPFAPVATPVPAASASAAVRSSALAAPVATPVPAPPSAPPAAAAGGRQPQPATVPTPKDQKEFPDDGRSID